MAGLKFLDLGFWLQSMTILLEIPVVSSIDSLKEIPCFKSTYLINPSLSAIIGRVYGSHSAMVWFALTSWPSFTKILEPNGMFIEYFSIPLLSIIIFPFLLKIILLENLSSINLIFSNFSFPSIGAWELDCSTDELAAPPIWNVLIVNWVPGSPIDWAAIIPTASPTFTEVPRAKSLP